MRANRRRLENVVPLTAIATWVLVAAFLCCGGLYYVFCKNQLHARGAQIKALERELGDLHTQNEVIKSHISLLSSPNQLRKRREQERKFLAEYVDITQDRLVLVNDTPSARADIRPVANSHP